MKDLLSYFHDCFHEDRTNTFVRDIYHKDIELRHYIEDDEQLFTGLTEHLYLNNEYASKLKKQAYVYRKEKEILYCSLFLVGVVYNQSGERTTICAPLIFHPACVEQENDYQSLKLIPGHTRFNYRLIEMIKDEPELLSTFSDTVEDILSDNILESAELQQLSNHLDKIINTIDSTLTINYPDLVTESGLKSRAASLSRKRSTSLQLVPASCIGLFKKGKETQGVLNELKAMTESNSLSAPLHNLFSFQNSKKKSKKHDGIVPAVLSTAQQNILNSSVTNTTTLMIGPPGTGKSYTIATLAMTYLSAGKSVLISSSRDQAVDVIADKIEEQLNIKQCVVRGGSKSYLKLLKKFVQDLLNGLYSNIEEEKKDKKRLTKSTKALIKKIDCLEKLLIETGQHEIYSGLFTANEDPTLLEKCRYKLHQLLHSSQKPLWKLLHDYNTSLDQCIEESRKLIATRHHLHIDNCLQKERSTLSTFSKGLRARTGGKKEDLFSEIDFQTLLQFFPIWLVKSNDLSRILPLQSEMFDLAIIDEATQCDIASCLPILQRAKKVVIAGDPNQLRHISFLSKAKMDELKQKHNLDDTEQLNYRKNSILDLYSESIQDQNCVHFLNEHYRSLPEIIRFSNRHFYDNRLHVMTEKAFVQANSPVQLHYCNGQRTKQGINQAELDAIIQQITTMIADDSETSVTIGVLSPFRNQVDLIAKNINKAISIDNQEKHKILVGTAHAFQGEERDVMLLSFVVDNDTSGNVTRFLDKPDVFNVSITRARSQQHLFYSCKPESLKETSLLRKYLSEHSTVANSEKGTTSSTIDIFASEVKEQLAELGFEVKIGYPLAGIRMDLIATKNDRSIAIDLVGYPGEFEEIFSLDRYRMFKRAGLTLFPLSYTGWTNDQQANLRAIESMFTSIS